MAMPKHDAAAHAPSMSGASVLTQSTDGRTYGLTEKHGADGLIAFETLALRGDKSPIGTRQKGAA